MQFSKHIQIFLYSFLFFGFLFLSAELNTIVQFGIILTLMLYNVSVDRYLLKLLSPLILILLLGILSFLGKGNDGYVLLKDIWYFSRPIVCLLCGYLIIKDYKIFMRVLILFGIISALSHFIIIVINYPLIIDFKLNVFRNLTGSSSFIEVLSLFLLLFHKEFRIGKITISRNLILVILFLSLVLYFSRTTLVTSLIIYFILKGYHQMKLKNLFIWVALIMIIIVSTLMIGSSDSQQGSFTHKVKKSLTEITMSSGFDTNKEKIEYWRAYEAFLAISQYWSKNNYIRLTGKGFGSTVDLMKEYNLGDSKMRFIPHIHNGFVNTLFKVGVIGILVYFLFLYYLLAISKNKFNIMNNKAVYIQRLIFAFGIYYIFSSLVIGGIYNQGEYSLFFLGAFIKIYINQQEYA
tara:strand:- start:1410 stop:2627 length:1218 start_codon:yes stop_codon:yes gene_type:complete